MRNSDYIDIPFCILNCSNSNLNNKTIYIYYNDYFTNFAKNIVNYFSKIAKSERCNVISEYNEEKAENLQLKVIDIFNKEDFYFNNAIILPHQKYYHNFIVKSVNALVIIEARYEEKIVNLVNFFLENGKEIYAVPSNIFRKNSYFSNFLIKQGAEIILNKNDLKYIVNNIIC